MTLFVESPSLVPDPPDVGRPSAAPGGPGLVSIAGAGPGDPELLTVRVDRLIREARVIVVDALVPEAIRALFPPTVRIFDVGKRAGDARSTPQEEINALLVRLAREGGAVLRLKGGDPLLFGRGGEEAQYLLAHGIPIQIVPGVTAAGGAAAAGIPLTHRGLSRSCTVLDGHGPHLESIDWPALVRLGGTWVFYMGKGAAARIAERLLAHGADPALGVALVESATLPGQTVTVATLDAAADGACRPETSGPGLVVVGPTVALARELGNHFNEGHLDVPAFSRLSETGGQDGAHRGWR